MYGDPSARHSTRDAVIPTVPAATGAQDVLLLLARVAIGALFVQSGLGKLANLAGFTAGMEGMGVPLAPGLSAVGAAVEFVGGLGLILGAWTWLAALLLTAFTVAATLLAHRFWEVPGAERMAQHFQFMKNLAILGGLLALMVAGAGRYSIDGLRRRRL